MILIKLNFRRFKARFVSSVCEGVSNRFLSFKMKTKSTLNNQKGGEMVDDLCRQQQLVRHTKILIFYIKIILHQYLPDVILEETERTVFSQSTS
jgi:hypothetical protein